MNWDQQLIEACTETDGSTHPHTGHVLTGAKWMRDQLRTNEAIEIAAQAIYAEERRVVDPAWPVWEDPRNGEARESTREAVRHMLAALLGEDQ